MEDSIDLDPGTDLFFSVFNPITNPWEGDKDEESSSERMTKDEARKAAEVRFDRFKTIHEEVRECIIEGLKQDGILLGPKQISPAKTELPYVSKSRIAELRQIRSSHFDLRRLVGLCEELNKCFGSHSFCATAAVLRAVIDHVPPVFGARSFAEVANNIGSRSAKASLLRLDTSSRNIADSVLHQQIRKREVLPTSIQVDFKNELDVLLAEIILRLGQGLMACLHIVGATRVASSIRSLPLAVLYHAG